MGGGGGKGDGCRGKLHKKNPQPAFSPYKVLTKIFPLLPPLSISLSNSRDGGEIQKYPPPPQKKKKHILIFITQNTF